MTEAIVLQKLIRRRGGCHLTVSSLDKPLIVPEGVIQEHCLVAGIVLTPPQLALLQAEADRMACDRAITRMLSAREHSFGEVRRKLLRKGFPKEIFDPIVAKFEATGFIDDARMAQKVVERLLIEKPAGRNWLVAYLRRRDIPRELAEATVDRYLVEADENQLAVRALKKKWPLIEQLELERARARAYNYLSRRGFGYPAAKAAFEELYNRR
jgi:SOS response regulatory protein OraA/RecX